MAARIRPASHRGGGAEGCASHIAGRAGRSLCHPPAPRVPRTTLTAMNLSSETRKLSTGHLQLPRNLRLPLGNVGIYTIGDLADRFSAGSVSAPWFTPAKLSK